MITEPVRATLADGRAVELRRLRPDDRDRLRAAFDTLSPASRYRRFLSPISHLSPSHVRYLTDVDQRDHIAWGAVDPARPEQPGVGVARCVRLRDEPTVAEAAVTVVDPWQGQGLGQLLLDVLARDAIAHGIRTFRGYVLPDNRPMRALIEGHGGVPSATAGGVLRIDLPLPDDAEDIPQSPSGRVLRAVARSEIPVAHNPFVEDGPDAP